MISSLAHIDPKARLGKDVTVEPFAVIQGDVVIGDGTWIGPHVVIYDGARIGNNCRIFNGASISAIPQDLKFNGEESTLEIGNDTTIREFATLNRGTRAKGKTVIGSNCLIMAYSHVAHDCVIGNNVVMVVQTIIGGEVIVDDWAIIGGGSGAHQFVHIGAHSITGGGSLIVMDVPPYSKAGRNPLSFMGINSVGLERRGFSKDKIHEIHEIYRAIYNMGKNRTQAFQYIEENFAPTIERDHILEFYRNSVRGVIRGR
jgi:UDP-N-acetylglucosamine acyltransferase